MIGNKTLTMIGKLTRESFLYKGDILLRGPWVVVCGVTEGSVDPAVCWFVVLESMVVVSPNL